MATKVADERKVGVIGARVREREIVVNAGNSLHATAVAMCKAGAIHCLGTADIGSSIAADRDSVVCRQTAGHARTPKELVADGAIHDLMNFGELLQAGLGTGVHTGNELELRLAEIGSDVRMAERGAERGRMRGRGERSVGL